MRRAFRGLLYRCVSAASPGLYGAGQYAGLCCACPGLVWESVGAPFDVGVAIALGGGALICSGYGALAVC